MSFIISQTKSTIKDALKHQAKLNNCKANDLQVIIGIQFQLNKEPEPLYYVIRDFEFYKRVQLSFRDLTGDKIDLLGKAELSRINFPKFIRRVADDKDLDVTKTEIMIITNDEKASDLGIIVYQNGREIKPITFEYFFGEDIDQIK